MIPRLLSPRFAETQTSRPGIAAFASRALAFQIMPSGDRQEMRTHVTVPPSTATSRPADSVPVEEVDLLVVGGGKAGRSPGDAARQGRYDRSSWWSRTRWAAPLRNVAIPTKTLISVCPCPP